MTPKQKKFCYEYLKDSNATQAAIRSGYSKKTAYAIGQKLLKKAEISEKIGEKARKTAEKAEINAEYVLNGLKSMSMNAKADSNKIRAYELLGKYLKLFTEKIEHSGNIDHQVDIRGISLLSDSELDKEMLKKLN